MEYRGRPPAVFKLFLSYIGKYANKQCLCGGSTNQAIELQCVRPLGHGGGMLFVHLSTCKLAASYDNEYVPPLWLNEGSFHRLTDSKSISIEAQAKNLAVTLKFWRK